MQEKIKGASPLGNAPFLNECIVKQLRINVRQVRQQQERLQDERTE